MDALAAAGSHGYCNRGGGSLCRFDPACGRGLFLFEKRPAVSTIPKDQRDFSCPVATHPQCRVTGYFLEVLPPRHPAADETNQGDRHGGGCEEPERWAQGFCRRSEKPVVAATPDRGQATILQCD